MIWDRNTYYADIMSGDVFYSDTMRRVWKLGDVGYSRAHCVPETCLEVKQPQVHHVNLAARIETFVTARKETYD